MSICIELQLERGVGGGGGGGSWNEPIKIAQLLVSFIRNKLNNVGANREVHTLTVFENSSPPYYQKSPVSHLGMVKMVTTL